MILVNCEAENILGALTLTDGDTINTCFCSVIIESDDDGQA